MKRFSKVSKVNVATTSLVFLLLFSNPAAAYIGPGAGLSAIGTLVAILGAGALLVVGFVWYPIKRLLRRNKKNPVSEREASTEDEA